MQTEKNLPQPLLIKEGRKKRHYLTWKRRYFSGSAMTSLETALRYVFLVLSKDLPQAITNLAHRRIRPDRIEDQRHEIRIAMR